MVKPKEEAFVREHEKFLHETCLHVSWETAGNSQGPWFERTERVFLVDCGYEIKFEKEWAGSANEGTVWKSCDSFTHQSLLLLELSVIG